MEHLHRYRWLITAGLVLLAGLGILVVLRSPAPPAPPAAAIMVYTPTLAPTASPLPTPTAVPIAVYVSGAVARPGVYTLPPGARVADALAAAGGATAQADLGRINLARRIQDEEHIHVPRPGEPTPAAIPLSAHQSPASSQGTAGKVNLNTATLEELDALPGIGPGYAQRIIEYRESSGPFKAVEEIQNVPGIGASTFARIRDLITVE